MKSRSTIISILLSLLATVCPPASAAPAPEPQAIRLAIESLAQTHPKAYTRSGEFLKRLAAIETAKPAKPAKGFSAAQIKQLVTLQREALLDANPLIDFKSLLLVKRTPRRLGLTANWQSNSSMSTRGYDNEIVSLSPVSPTGKLTTVYKPKKGAFVGDVDLDFDAKRILFSSPGKNGRWQLCELDLGKPGAKVREIKTIPDNDVDNYDACYLPDGNIIFTSTAPFIGVPCVRGGSHVTNLYRLDRKPGTVRRLTFDQEHNWCPTVMNDGSVLYQRWEYADVPHYVARLLFNCNPDGTNQMEFYGSNSYWPNSMFYARPIPSSATKFVTIVTGHHGVKRFGELILFDAAKSRHEAKGVIQRIPGRGKKVKPIILDRLVDKSWPKFLHPYPLSDKFILVTAQLSKTSPIGLYLVDTFDNIIPILEDAKYAYLEPIPLRETTRPPVIPSRIDLTRKDAQVYISDIYVGPGLRGVPRGTVKKLRLFTYNFSYWGMGGQVDRVGLDGPWDIKTVLGTVPVESDGSALFTVPANMPISVQPLDENGNAIQLMRSWMTAMPGETLSCVGCHEDKNDVAPTRKNIAGTRKPSVIKPWYGPVRGFSFRREVQPVLNKYCVGCHSPKTPKLHDLTDRPDVNMSAKKENYNSGAHFSPSYMILKAFLRTPSIESDYHLNAPYEFHANTSPLIQMLRAGHHNVKLNPEAWDRLGTWIDLNTPFHGTWLEMTGAKRTDKWATRRRDLLRRYGGRDELPEAIGKPADLGAAILPKTAATTLAKLKAKIAPAKAVRKSITLDLGNKMTMTLNRIPASKTAKAFWIAALETSNQQFAQFDPKHSSRLEHGEFLQFSVKERGWPLNGPTQPVCRVSQQQALAFCKWLSTKTGKRVTLPTEAQWEYACRAHTRKDMWFGTVDSDFSKCANLADKSFRHVGTLDWGLPSGAIPPYRRASETINDKYRVTAPVGKFAGNGWGLKDMHGNVAEWTRSVFTPGQPQIAVRGGSFSDVPKRATSSFRIGYYPWQKIYNVGFRVVIEN